MSKNENENENGPRPNEDTKTATQTGHHQPLNLDMDLDLDGGEKKMKKKKKKKEKDGDVEKEEEEGKGARMMHDAGAKDGGGLTLKRKGEGFSWDHVGQHIQDLQLDDTPLKNREHHHSILVDPQTQKAAQPGSIYPVKGNIQAVMIYKYRPARDDDVNQGKEFLGTTAVSDLDGADEIYREVPAPKRQFNRPKRLYPRGPLGRCQEWRL
ncbi:hypothetical protein F4778DRAFT_780205 [Xylariomycetidae sp. FL2044]|nr:hypothetical protein F4778DRAFT_780205 [Xylariomycetidae sp. FL2044]